MREKLVIAAAVASLGIGWMLGRVVHRPANTEHSSTDAKEAAVEANTKVAPAKADDRSIPVTTHEWKGPEKAMAVRRVQELSKSDADYVCLLLGLIPEDEVFDKVNTKGRLSRYVEAMRDPSELEDLEKALQQLARNHASL